MAIDPEVIEKLLGDCRKPEQILGQDGLLKQLTKAILERVLEGELTEHLGYEKHDPAGYHSGNSRNGKSRKTIKGEFGEVEIETPRDRKASFEPKMIGKGQTRFSGFDGKIVSMYARGMTTRDIQSHLEEMYGVEVSPGLISTVTDAVVEEVHGWQSRPLDKVYPIVYLDALYVRMRDNNQVQNRAVYVAIGVKLDGCKEVWGLWTSSTEGAKFWMSVLTELRNRGLEDMFVTCVDGLKGFPEAIEAMYPRTQVQLCVVHLVRASLKYVSWKQRKQIAGDLRLIYTAATAEAAEQQLGAFEARWGKSHPAIGQIWRRNWERIIPFFSYPPEIRKVIYTTNAIESLNMSLRKVIKTRGSFPNEEAALKLLYLALRNAAKKWQSVQGWKDALNRFHILWPERMPALEQG